MGCTGSTLAKERVPRVSASMLVWTLGAPRATDSEPGRAVITKCHAGWVGNYDDDDSDESILAANAVSDSFERIDQAFDNDSRQRTKTKLPIAVDDELFIDPHLHARLLHVASTSHLQSNHIQFIDKSGRRRLLHRNSPESQRKDLHRCRFVDNINRFPLTVLDDSNFHSERSTSATASLPDEHSAETECSL